MSPALLNKIDTLLIKRGLFSLLMVVLLGCRWWSLGRRVSVGSDQEDLKMATQKTKNGTNSFLLLPTKNNPQPSFAISHGSTPPGSPQVNFLTK